MLLCYTFSLWATVTYKICECLTDPTRHQRKSRTEPSLRNKRQLGEKNLLSDTKQWIWNLPSYSKTHLMVWFEIRTRSQYWSNTLLISEDNWGQECWGQKHCNFVYRNHIMKNIWNWGQGRILKVLVPSFCPQTIPSADYSVYYL